jgi:hypothetical protein
MDVSAKALAGAEYCFGKHWALTFDCKYLCIVSLTFHGEIPGSCELWLEGVHVLKQAGKIAPRVWGLHPISNVSGMD